MKYFIRFLAVLTALLTVISSLGIAVSAEETDKTDKGNPVIAHWKFQNEEGCFTGSIEEDSFTILDLSGNGNDLVVASEGNGDQLDIFSWDTGVDVSEEMKENTAKSALKIDNSWTKAHSVDPYESEQTAYSGGYVSGKYLETIETAPMNNLKADNGWTVEIVFKVSPDWDNDYNRYVGLFSRQGVVESQNEPSFSMALTELVSGGNEDGTLGDSGSFGIQYVHVDPDEVKHNEEMCNGQLYAGEWMHYMVTSDGGYTECYLNGELVKDMFEENLIYIDDPLFSWEIGVGRKLKDDKATMNPDHPEGLIRRLFCGSISEIRVSYDYMDIEDSLLYTSASAPAESEDTAAAETTAEPEKPTLAKDNVINLWDTETFGSLFKTGNQTEAALTEEGLVLTYTGDENATGDPYFTFPIANYYKKVTNDAPKPENANWVVFKVKCTGGDGTFELFTATPAGGDSSTGEYTADGTWQYVMIDMSLTTLVEGRKLSTMRMDWSGGGVVPGAAMTIAEVGFFTEEKEACEYCGIEYVTMAPRTKAPATEAPTEAAAETATEAVTEAPKSGCGAVVVSAAAVVVMAAAAAVAIKRKH